MKHALLFRLFQALFWLLACPASVLAGDGVASTLGQLTPFWDWFEWAVHLIPALLLTNLYFSRRFRHRIVDHVGPLLNERLRVMLRKLMFNRLIWLALGFVGTYLTLRQLGGLCLYLTELHRPSDSAPQTVDSLRECAHALEIFMFGGLENRLPRQDSWGWVVFATFSLGGVFAIAYFSSVLITILFQWSREFRMTTNSAEGGYLIIGYNDQTCFLIDQLQAAFRLQVAERPIAVLGDIAEAQSPGYDRYEGHGIAFNFANTFNRDVLRQIGAHKARSIIILADRTKEDPDAYTALVALALNGLFLEEKLPHRPRLTIEVVNHRKQQLIREAAGSASVISARERPVPVCHEDFGVGILVQDALFGTAGVYEGLLSFSAHTNEIYVVRGRDGDDPGEVDHDIWDLLRGLSYQQVSEFMARHRTDILHKPVLIGLWRRGEVTVNPDGEEHLRDGDGLVLLSFEFPGHLQSFNKDGRLKQFREEALGDSQG